MPRPTLRVFRDDDLQQPAAVAEAAPTMARPLPRVAAMPYRQPARAAVGSIEPSRPLATPSPTITDLWEGIVRDDLLRQVNAGLVPRDRLQQYGRAMDCWLAFWSQPQTEKPPAHMAGGLMAWAEPPLPVPGRTFREWMDWCRGSQGVSERTVRKWLVCLQGIVREGTDGDQRLPRVKHRPHVPRSYKLDLDAAAWQALYEACDHQVWPVAGRRSTPGRVATGLADVDPPAWWRCAIVMFATYGFRTQELLAYDPDQAPLDWTALHWSPAIPVTGCRIENAAGWLTYTPQKQEATKPEPLTLPLTAGVRAHLRSLWPDDQPPAAGPVLPMPRANKQLRHHWKRLVAAAGLTRYAGVDGLLMKHLRSSHATWVESIREGMGEVIQGRASRTVTWKHYIQRVGLIVETLDELAGRLPACMVAPPAARQLRLF